MGHLLLTSTGFYYQNVRNQFSELLSRRKSAVIITTASPKKECNQFAIQAMQDLKSSVLKPLLSWILRTKQLNPYKMQMLFI